MTTLRPAALVMHLPRMGAFHQTRLSFMRSLLRDIAKTQVRFTRKLWDINKDGEGSAVYEIRIGKHIYSLAAYGHNLPPEKRSDRVIAEEWDATFTLVNGEVSAQDAEAMRRKLPNRKRGGRITANWFYRAPTEVCACLIMLWILWRAVCSRRAHGWMKSVI